MPVKSSIKTKLPIPQVTSDSNTPTIKSIVFIDYSNNYQLFLIQIPRIQLLNGMMRGHIKLNRNY